MGWDNKILGSPFKYPDKCQKLVKNIEKLSGDDLGVRLFNCILDDY
jgi:hypothetical protein